MSSEPIADRTTLFVFMDESGNLDFSKKGTKHFVLSAVFTENPIALASAVLQLKYDLMAGGANEKSLEFHATENNLHIRDRFVEVIVSIRNQHQVHSIYVDKRRAAPRLQNSVEILALLGSAMGKWLDECFRGKHDHFVLVFDSVLTGKERDAFKAKLKTSLKQMKTRFTILFHPVKSEPVGQVADYYSWSLYRALESRDRTWKQKLAYPQWDNFHLFRNGHTEYWRPDKNE